MLPTGAVLDMGKIVDDAINPFGPTATPLITSPSRSRRMAHCCSGWAPRTSGLFSVGSTGRLTLRNGHVKGFIAKGGDGGAGGGGLGAGGAIFVHAGAGNEAHTFGAGIAVIDDGAPTFFTLQNTILASNFANDGRARMRR